jgi:hypothetical protein
MVYTRCWFRPKELDAEKFRLFAEACQKAAAQMGDILNSATFTPEDVSIEGSPGCETFTIDRISISEGQEELLFEFCRTELLPYDAVVERCLNLLKEYFPEVDIPNLD